DCGTGAGYGPFGSASSASCPTTDVGTRMARAQIRDRDGDVNEYEASVQVFVTYASLCDLVRSYIGDEANVADGLCQKLSDASSASTETARQGKLEAFRNQVDAKAGDVPGKALTAPQAELLKRLSTRL